MRWRLPPMNALKAVEAAGRHMSFTRAAEKLHVTPGAISRQVRLLEDHLGATTFDRQARDLHLADAASEYVKALTEAFERLDVATRRFMHAQRGRPLHIHCSMTFTLRWLRPRLTAFHASHPTHEIRLTTAVVPITSQLGTGDVDVNGIPFSTAPFASRRSADPPAVAAFSAMSPPLHTDDAAIPRARSAATRCAAGAAPIHAPSAAGPMSA